MTVKRKRRPVPKGEFADPDLNFEPPAYADSFERALAQDTVLAMETAPFTAVAPATPVEAVLRVMVKKDVACVMVIDGGKLVGLISERDVLVKVVGRFDQLRRKPCTLVMTRDPVFVYETDNPARALNLMATGGFRHVPILDADERVVGIIGPRRVLNYFDPYLHAKS